MTDIKAPRDAFGQVLVELGHREDRLFVLSGDLAEATKVNGFGKVFPERFLNTGIAEQNMIGMAAGLARMGHIPVVSTFCCFAPGRTYDQIRQTVAYSNENVKIISTHPGLAIGMDGAIHQSLDDIALMRALPNMVVLAPSDEIETEKAVAWAIQHQGPVYIRVGRKECQPYFKIEWAFEAGKGYTLRQGSDITLIGHGAMVALLMEAAEQLQAKGIEAWVIDMPSLKPVDTEIIIQAARQTKGILTAEDHFLNGGLFSVVSEVTAQNHPCPVKGIGVDDQFGESGDPEDLYEKHGLTVAHIIEKALTLYDLKA